MYRVLLERGAVDSRRVPDRVLKDEKLVAQLRVRYLQRPLATSLLR